jgi:hypothetical protein
VSRSISTVRRAPPPDELGLRFPSWPTRTFAYSLGRAFGATVMILLAEQHRGEREGNELRALVPGCVLHWIGEHPWRLPWKLMPIDDARSSLSIL